MYHETGSTTVMNRWKFLASKYLIDLSQKPANHAYEAVRRVKNLGLRIDWGVRSMPTAIIALE